MSDELQGSDQQLQQEIDRQTQQEPPPTQVGIQSDALDPTKLQRELEQLAKDNENLRKQAGQFQSQAEKSQRALAALAGDQFGTPHPTSPAQAIFSRSYEYAKNQMGLSDKDAQSLATMQAQSAEAILGPIQSQLSAFQASQQVDPVIAQAAGANPWVAQQLSDPNTYAAVKQILTQNASQGYAPTPDLVVNATGMAFARTAGQTPAATQTPAPNLFQQFPQFGGTTFQGSGFHVRPQQGSAQPALSAYQQEIQNQLDKSLKK